MKEKKGFLPQFSYLASDGKVIECKPFMPTDADGVYYDVSNQMEKAIKENFPEYLEEYQLAKVENYVRLELLFDKINKPG